MNDLPFGVVGFGSGRPDAQDPDDGVAAEVLVSQVHQLGGFEADGLLPASTEAQHEHWAEE
jgi:hypothetical protein